jgi:hypothetical protein
VQAAAVEQVDGVADPGTLHAGGVVSLVAADDDSDADLGCKVFEKNPVDGHRHRIEEGPRARRRAGNAEESPGMSVLAA